MTAQDRRDAAVEVSPVSVLVRGVLEWVFPGHCWTDLYAQAPRCWTRKLTIEALFWMTVDVVAGTRNSVFAADQADQAREVPTMPVSAPAVYDKLGRMPHEFGSLLVRESAQRLAALLAHAQPRHFPGLKPYRIRLVDGTELGGTEHRLGVLRGIKAAGLPGRLVVCHEWATGLCSEAIASEDAYASERVLVREILDRVQTKDLFVMDRFYCTTPVMQAIRERQAAFVIRADERNVRCRTRGRARDVGRTATGRVFEQTLEVEDTQTGEQFLVRRVVVRLKQPTEDGETEVRLLTNLPAAISALRIAELYRERWTLERYFDFLKNCLHGEIESLGQPLAALFMMCLALVAGNALAVVRQAIRTLHGDAEAARLSGYYLADELAKHQQAIDVLVTDRHWRHVQRLSVPAFWTGRVASPSAFDRAHFINIRGVPNARRRSAPPENTATTTRPTDYCTPEKTLKGMVAEQSGPPPSASTAGSAGGCGRCSRHGANVGAIRKGPTFNVGPTPSSLRRGCSV